MISLGDCRCIIYINLFRSSSCEVGLYENLKKVNHKLAGPAPCIASCKARLRCYYSLEPRLDFASLYSGNSKDKLHIA